MGKNRSDLNLDQAKIFNVYLRVKIYYSCEKKKKSCFEWEWVKERKNEKNESNRQKARDWEKKGKSERNRKKVRKRSIFK